MKKQKWIVVVSHVYVFFSVFSVLCVAVMAFINPQQVMDLVQVKLTNNDAFSSIRGVYGGVGIGIALLLLYTLKKSLSEALGMLIVFWGLYAASRVVTVAVEGPLGDFGQRWFVIEATFSLLAVVLLLANKKTVTKSFPAKPVIR